MRLDQRPAGDLHGVVEPRLAQRRCSSSSPGAWRADHVASWRTAELADQSACLPRQGCGEAGCAGWPFGLAWFSVQATPTPPLHTKSGSGACRNTLW
jgi:hypothetical protein